MDDFEKNNISELSDIIPLDRISAIKTFKKSGFIHTELEKKELIFSKENIAKQLIITNEMYRGNGTTTKLQTIELELAKELNFDYINGSSK